MASKKVADQKKLLKIIQASYPYLEHPVLRDKKRLTVDGRLSRQLLTYSILRSFLYRVREALVQNYDKKFIS